MIENTSYSRCDLSCLLLYLAFMYPSVQQLLSAKLSTILDLLNANIPYIKSVQEITLV